MLKTIKRFITLESSTGILLGFAALFAIIIKNSSLTAFYDSIINLPLSINIGEFLIKKPAIIWVNDFLMAFFFLLVGLELKREWLEGQLSKKVNCALPLIAALGGIIFPALIYVYFNRENAVALQGWAIPAATDIAFALGVLSLLGNRIPSSLKLCLLSLAIFDDLAAILIIALFYTDNLSLIWLLISALPLFMLSILNKYAIRFLTPYLLIGLLLWICILKSGIHPTIAGILLALFIPLQAGSCSPLKTIEHRLHPLVSFCILPLFAFFNAGVSLQGLSIHAFTQPIALGIMAGLFFGKQIGVMFFSFVGARCGWCALPIDVTWRQYYGMAILTGIGFTMSLFIGMLAFSDPALHTSVRLSVIAGSLASGIIGYSILFFARSPRHYSHTLYCHPHEGGDPS